MDDLTGEDVNENTTIGVYKCDDCDFNSYCETKIQNQTQIKHI